MDGKWGWFAAAAAMVPLFSGVSVSSEPPLRDRVAQAIDACHDQSPHQIRFVDVGQGVRVEVLDWGGTGDAVVLLAGLGNTGHVFDELAPKLTDRFRVVALTRRGFGASDQPKEGYRIETLVDDVEHVIEALTLERVALVGHSIAGDEMTGLATKYPKGIARLVYLDAAYDRVGYHPDVPPPPAPTADDLVSPRALRAYRGRIVALQPEAEICATVRFEPDGRAQGTVTPPALPAAIASSLKHPNYSAVRVPALAIYAVPERPADLAPNYSQADSSARSRIDVLFQSHLRWASGERERFRSEAPLGRVVELRGADHYFFFSHPREVLDMVRAFLLE